MTKKQLQTLQSALPSLEERVDISSVKIDTDISTLQQAEQYITQIKNPYAFRSAGIAVDIEFCENGKSLEQAIQSYLTAQKRIN